MNPEAPPPLPKTRSSSPWLGILVGLVLLFAVGAAAWRGLVVHTGHGGASTALPSPQKEYLAMARTVTEDLFWGGQRQFFELTLSKREVHENDPNHPWRYQPDRTVVVDRIAGLPFPERGSDACAIQWLPDVSQVTFDLQGVMVSISTKNL